MASIVFITGSLPPIRCGVGFYAERLLQELAKAGQQNLTVLATDGVTNSSPFPLETVPDWRIRRLPRLLKTIRQAAPDIVHIQYPAVGYGRQLGINLLPYLIRWRLKSATLVVTLHEYHESRWIGKLRDFITVLPARRIILSNEADRRALPGKLGERSTIIPISSSIARVSPNAQLVDQIMDQAGLDPTKPTLLFFGFAHPNKRLELLAPLLAEPSMAAYQALLLTGLDEGDPYHQRLVTTFNDLNNSGQRIGWTGFLPDEQVSAVLQAGDYFVLPQAEPLAAKSSTAITAALHGLIVVSAGSGDRSATAPFEDGLNACLVWPITVQALAEAISRVDGQPELKQKLKSGAQALENYFSWDNIIKLHQAVYETHRN